MPLMPLIPHIRQILHTLQRTPPSHHTYRHSAQPYHLCRVYRTAQRTTHTAHSRNISKHSTSNTHRSYRPNRSALGSIRRKERETGHRNATLGTKMATAAATAARTTTTTHLLRQCAARAANAFPWVCNFHSCRAERTRPLSRLASPAAASNKQQQ